jgi:ketosteroid isomerase-like protein
MSDPKIEAVQRLYEAYSRGDVEAVLAELADDVDWAAEAASTSVPWYGSHRGKAEVAPFFKEIGSNIEVTEFTPRSFTSNDTDVIAAVGLHGELDRQERSDAHAALVAIRRRQDRLLPGFGGHGAVGLGVFG